MPNARNQAFFWILISDASRAGRFPDVVRGLGILLNTLHTHTSMVK